MLATTKKWWDDFGAKAAEGGWDIGRCDARCLAINMHVGPTREDAIRAGRNAHDQWIRFLAPYGRFRSYTFDSLTYEVHTVGVDGSDDAVIGTIDIGSGTDVFLPEAELFDGTAVHFVPNGLSVVPGAWRFEPTADAIGVIAPVEPDARYSAQPVDVAGGLLVTVDAERIGSFTSNRAEAQFFTLSAIDRSASVAIDDLDPDYMILSAALSPDGAHLAVFEYYRGDDTMVANSEASGRVSIAPTASLFQGDPTWATLDGIGPGAPSLDLDRGFSTITWPSTDHVYVELLDRAFAVDVVPS